MKTVLPRHEFHEALSAVATLISTRTPRPILSCVRLSARGEVLELAGTDGEATLRIEIAALSVPKVGEAVVPAERLTGIVREMSDVEVVIETDESQCIVRGEGSEFRIFAANAADFPPLPEFGGDSDLIVDGNLLRRMASLTLFAAARENSRFAINGVLWEKQGKRLSFVATDGRRLARAGGTVQQARSGDFEVILPAKALGVFERVFQPRRGEESWLVNVKVTPNQMLLWTHDRGLATVLVEGQFPKYQDVIPKGYDKHVVLSRDALLAAVRSALLLTTEESRAVRLAFGAGKLVLTSQSPEHGQARVEIPARYDGPPLDIAFNPVFLAEALRVLPFEEVTFDLQESSRPGVLCGDDKAEFLYVVMPVSL